MHLRTLLPFLLALACAGCGLDDEKRVGIDDMRFETESHTLMFFRNVRQLAYDVESKPERFQEFFRHEDRPKEAGERLPLNPMIVYNSKSQKAFLMLEKEGALAEAETVTLRWAYPKSGVSETATLSRLARIPEHFEVATRLYRALQEGAKIEIETPDGPRPFLQDEEDRKVFRTVMVDFYRLVNILK